LSKAYLELLDSQILKTSPSANELGDISHFEISKGELEIESVLDETYSSRGGYSLNSILPNQ
jgi:hypothetical protein